MKHTDPVMVPAADQAAAILFKLASPFFNRWLAHGKENEQAYKHWQTLRRIGTAIERRREAKLQQAEADALVIALAAAHELAHETTLKDAGDGPCTCKVAEDIRDFITLTHGAEAGLL